MLLNLLFINICLKVLIEKEYIIKIKNFKFNFYSNYTMTTSGKLQYRIIHCTSSDVEYPVNNLLQQ